MESPVSDAEENEVLRIARQAKGHEEAVRQMQQQAASNRRKRDSAPQFC
ncbi:MAG: hypothetical protein RLZZ416_161 [Candidatus Parcubacteria bacterium]|jgi:hypothetical protein